MNRLGRKQLQLLSAIAGVRRALVVPDKISRSLCERGLMQSASSKTDGFIVLTPAGYRAVADALERGTIKRLPAEEWNQPARTETAP